MNAHFCGQYTGQNKALSRTMPITSLIMSCGNLITVMFLSLLTGTMTIQLRASHVGQEQAKNASRRHHLILSSPLPPQKIVLTVDENKRQLTDIICEYTVERARANEEPARHKLLVSGREPLPLELLRGHKRNREDLRTTHEEAGVTMMYQGIQSARSGVQSVKVISDDTDVFALLMHFSIQNKKSRSFIIEAQVKRVSQLIYTHP